MSTARSSYKGNALIVLEPDSKYPFQFGVAKARLILANIDAIRAFVAEQPEVTKLPAGKVSGPWTGQVQNGGGQ